MLKNVICFSGHDPSGGAGIQADMESLIMRQCRPLSVITCLTEQNTQNVFQLIPQNSKQFEDQALRLMQDIPIDAIKIGLIGDINIAKAIHNILHRYPSIPVILDPVLAAGGGQELATHRLIQYIMENLLPFISILTPNEAEARSLSQNNGDLSGVAKILLNTGCQHVLITGADSASKQVINRFYSQDWPDKEYQWERLPNSYHGSGCTLASSITGFIAHKAAIDVAVFEAQKYTWKCLQHATQPGQGQFIPNRFFELQNSL